MARVAVGGGVVVGDAPLVAELTGTPPDRVFMMLAAGGLRITHCTLHESVATALGRIDVGEMGTNLCFLPGDRRGLFLTTPTRALVVEIDVPENRLASLRLPVQWLCDGTAVDPGDGRIWLNDQRMLLWHSSAMGHLRRELVDALAQSAARGVQGPTKEQILPALAAVA